MESTGKTFTVTQANKMLPLVGSITRDLKTLHEQVELRQCCLEAASPYSAGSQDLYAEEVGEIRESIAADRNRIAAYVAELEALGLEVHSARQGCVDFPAYRDGERVALCWKTTDEGVSHWHFWGDLGSRREITADERFDSCALQRPSETSHSAVD